jgi:phosphomannomutase/phosphoglucomutase
MHNPKETIVTPVSSSQLVRDIAEEQGGRVEWTRVGSINVSRRMEEIGSKLGGEENGGIFYGPHIPVRDGAMAAAMIVELLAKTGRKLSELLGELPHYHTIKTKIACPENRKDHVLAEVTKVISGRTVETIDGVKIWRDRRSWILIRPSGTEPIFRIFVEAPSRDEANNLLGEYVTVLRDLIDEGVYDGKPAHRWSTD